MRGMRWNGLKGGVAAALVVGLCAGVAWAAAGDLDTSFGVGGIARTPGATGSQPNAWDSVVLPDGKILLAGGEWTGLRDANNLQIFQWVVRRFLSDGSLDTGFGVAGKLTLLGSDLSGANEAREIALDSAGRIVLAGMTPITVTTGSGRKAVTTKLGVPTIVRLLSNGALDTSFGVGGVMKAPLPGGLGGSAFGMLIQPDGRIVIGGNTSIAPARRNDPSDGVIFLARYLANGALDATFGSGGLVIHNPSTQDEWMLPKALGRQSDGRLVVGSKVFTASGGSTTQNWVITRFQQNGAFDGGFGVVSEPGRTLLRMTVGPSDEIVASGYGPHAGHSYDLVVERRLPSGALDTAFGSGGLAYAGIYDQNQGGMPAVQADGKIVVIGLLSPPTGNVQSTVFRFNLDGTPDSTFGSGGMGQPYSLEFSLSPLNVCFAQDGSIYVTGGTQGTGIWDWYLARYLVN